MSENKSIFLTDSPNIEQDSFQVHTNIAETLYDILTKHNVSKNSFTIGLFGEWGSGKSFIINKLYERIKKNKDKNITYLYIDIWKYSGFPLLRSILFDLDKQFLQLYVKDTNKYREFSDGYKKNGHSLNFQLKYTKHLKEESKLTPKESWERLYGTLKKYKIVWVILITFLLFFLAPLLLPTDLKESNTYKSFIPFLNAIKSFISFTGIGAVILILLKKPIQDIGNLVFFRSVVRDYTEQANFSPEQFEDIFKDILYPSDQLHPLFLGREL
ncbi:MAG: P-loop NTPase fold protein [Bacteroidales bacterium]|jgi:GTPase SAR1 family protein|nr:P-loop NTPase fold protein [Bacteroidales bacterium]